MNARLGLPLVAVLLLSAGLAGCIGGDDDEIDAATTETPDTIGGTVDTLTPGEDDAPAPEPGALPAWTHGDWWTYDLRFDPGFGELLSGPTTVVVHRTGTDYGVAAVDRNAAIVDAHFDMFLVGTVDLSLNPPDADAFQMFDFPLEDGKTWSTSFDYFGTQHPLTMTATAIDNAGDPAGATPGFRITGEGEGGVRVEYVYSPLSKWVTSLTMEAVDFNGEPFTMMELTLQESGANFQGTFVLLEMTPIYQRFLVPIAPDPALQPVPPVDTITVADGFTFVQRVVGVFPFSFEGLPPVGAQVVGLVDPAGAPTPYLYTGGDDMLAIEYDEPAVAGDWHVAYAGHGTLAAFVGFWGFTETIVAFDQSSHAHHQ